jgi:hypothetical protein
MKISDFVANISGGLARTNRFHVIFTPPQSVTVAGLMPQQQLMMLCDQVQIPGLSVNTTGIRTFGEVRETPYEYNYEPINIQFYVDQKMDVKTFWDRWIKSIQKGSTRSFRYYDEYICKKMEIYVENLLDQKTYLVALFEVYPKSVTAIQLDYAAKDVMKIQVTLEYKYWLSTNAQGDTGAQNQKKSTELIEVPQPIINVPKFKVPDAPKYIGPTPEGGIGVQGRTDEIGAPLTPFA